MPLTHKKYQKKKAYKTKVHSEIKLVCLRCLAFLGERRHPKFFNGKLYGNNLIKSSGLSRHLASQHLCDNHYKFHVEGKHPHRFTTSRVELHPELRMNVTFTAEQLGLTGTGDYAGHSPTCVVVGTSSTNDLNARLDKQVFYDDSVDPISRSLIRSDICSPSEYYVEYTNPNNPINDDHDSLKSSLPNQKTRSPEIFFVFHHHS